MEIGLVVYGGLDETSGGFRYDRQLVDYLRECGDSVEVIALPWTQFWAGLVDGISPAVTSQLNRPVDVLVQDELCFSSLWRQNHRLTNPGAVVALVHLVQTDNQRGRFPQLSRWIERQYLDSVDGAICTSGSTRRAAVELGGEFDESLVAPPAGRAEGPACSETHVRQRAAEQPLRIVFVGNLLPRKDPVALLSAVARLSTHHDCADWRLTVVGSHAADPAYASEVVKTATALGIADRVEFTGEISDAELTATLEASHVCCVPARYEGFGMVYLEAMEYGVVPIASARGGAGEFVTDGVDGFLVGPGDTEQIAALLSALATDRERLADLGAAALQTAVAHPSWDETLADVRAFLKYMPTNNPSPQTERAATQKRHADRGGET